MILRKRGWMILLPAVLFTIVGLGVAHFVPPQYVSQTLVLIEQQTVPDAYVKPVISEDLNARLASMKEQILSRSRLQPIIEKYNLYATQKSVMDDRIDQVRKDIDIKPIESTIARTGGLPGFFISFKAGDPHTAQQVCGEITSLFVSENLRSRAASAQGTTDFLQGQLDDAKRNLDEQDAKLADFQRQYMGRLPEEVAPNMNMLSSLNSQLDASTQQLAQLQQNKSYEEAMLAAQTRDLPSPDLQRAQPQAQQAELQSLLAQESDLTTRYTEDYPDVRIVKQKIKDLRAEMAKPQPAAPAAAPSNRPEPLNITQLRAQIHAVEQMIAQKSRDQAQIQAQIRTYQDRISSSPMVQEQFKTLTRDYQTAQTFYDDLLKKMEQSKMATDLEKRQQGEQFRVMDEPNLPEEPTYPKKIAFEGAGFAAGLMIGLLIVGWIEYRDTAVRSERDIWAFTKLPTLAVISYANEVPVSSNRSWFKFGRHKDDVTPANKPLMNAGG
jgi:polysaccharide chain length determinant protein (PEP-CTERM system associated)